MTGLEQSRSEMTRRAVAWLRQYVQGPGGSLIEENVENVITGLQLLICGDVMTPEVIRRELIQEQNVILPAAWYNMAARQGHPE